MTPIQYCLNRVARRTCSRSLTLRLGYRRGSFLTCSILPRSLWQRQVIDAQCAPYFAHFVRLLLVRSMSPWFVSLVLLLSLASCQTTERDSDTYIEHGQKYCSKHRIPFVTRRVFEPGNVVATFDCGTQRCADCANASPNCLPLRYSVHRTSFYNSPTVYSYCPRCEDEFRACSGGLPK